ncbi:hypothetical protein HOH87_07105 [bacterium]|jgi:hypothetical protein|nr:hypothetical protein [bacterium]
MAYYLDPALYMRPQDWIDTKVAMAQTEKGQSPNAFSDKLSHFLELTYDTDRDALSNLTPVDTQIISPEEALNLEQDATIEDSGKRLTSGPRIDGHEGVSNILTDEELNVIKWTAALEFNSLMMTKKRQNKMTKKTAEKNKKEKLEQEMDTLKHIAKVEAQNRAMNKKANSKKKKKES